MGPWSNGHWSGIPRPEFDSHRAPDYGNDTLGKPSILYHCLDGGFLLDSAMRYIEKVSIETSYCNNQHVKKGISTSWLHITIPNGYEYWMCVLKIQKQDTTTVSHTSCILFVSVAVFYLRYC